ncbi:MAG: hypothetical protein HKL87_05115 [Acidimicrobiaceae bacterium]|nr:hypothetical protein [Acidimicrobiaceae bacterium]
MTQPFFSPSTRAGEVRPSQHIAVPELGRPQKVGVSRHPGEGSFRGTPAPNEGYAFVLARRALDNVVAPAPASHHDLVTAVALLGAKRAGADMRAPTASDVAWASRVVESRGGSLAGLSHSYPMQRRFVDSVDLGEFAN